MTYTPCIITCTWDCGRQEHFLLATTPRCRENPQPIKDHIDTLVECNYKIEYLFCDPDAIRIKIHGQCLKCGVIGKIRYRQVMVSAPSRMHIDTMRDDYQSCIPPGVCGSGVLTQTCTVVINVMRVTDVDADQLPKVGE